jgi:poly(3-hydroxybutyrate) depolymerase
VKTLTRPLALLLLAAAVAPAAARAISAPLVEAPSPRVRVWTIEYRAHGGLERRAYVVLPRWYGPRRNPPVPLVISPHGRGAKALGNAARWGDLPARGGFAVVNPEGQGRRLALYSWGNRGETADLARMPDIVTDALPWLHVDRHRVYAFGGSMGGQETLLLVARYPRLLAGAASFDAPTNMALRYRDFAHMRYGRELQELARLEIGGTPRTHPGAYAARSPIDNSVRIAYAGVPLQLWWSSRDRIIADQSRESALLYRRITWLNPTAPIWGFQGTWAHTAEMRDDRRLPQALRIFGLLPRLHRKYALSPGLRLI